jgi:hypothetical protein
VDGFLLGVAGPHDGLDISADVEVAFDFDAQRIAGSDEVFQDDIDNVLVEDLHASERVDVELQTLQLDTPLVGYVLESNGGEVRKIGERTDGGELRDLEIDLDFTARKLVGERIERKEFHFRPWR